MPAFEESADIPRWVALFLQSRILDGETPLASFEPDLDSRMRYAPGLVVLTDQRLLSFEWPPGSRRGPDGAMAEAEARSWALAPGLDIHVHEERGLGSLDLRDGTGTISRWRFTNARAAGAHRLAEWRTAMLNGAVPPRTTPHPDAVADCEYCGFPVGPGAAACGECGTPVSKPPLQSLLRLLPLARRYWGLSLLGFLLTLAGTASGLVPPYLTMPLLDGILVPYQSGHQPDTSMVKWYLLGLAGASVLSWAITWAQMYVISSVSERVAADLRLMTYSHLQKLSLEYFGRRRTGDLISRVGSDTDRICYFLSVHALDFGTNLVMLVLTSIILFSIDAGMALVTLLPMPFIAIAVFRVQGRLGRGFSVGNRAWAELTSILADTIPGIRVVKAFAQEDREIQRMQHANQRVLRTNNRVNRVWAYFNAVVLLLTELGVVIVWVAGVYRVFHHSVTVGVLAAFVAYITRFYTQLDSMSRMASATERAASSARRVFAILDRKPKVADSPDSIEPGRLRGAIELRNVSFRYGARPVLRGIDLSIAPGEMIGLVGRSGAGKTTIINLLCRFYDVTDGAILVDGVDLRRYRLNEYRRNVGLVLQEPFLFYGTVAENIAYGRPGATPGEIVKAAKAAHAHEFILRLPNGYDSLVGERGQFLSGGERQRLSIARALLIDPRILILDEATSSVDSETEREIQLALENLTRERTTIAIAHRLSTLKKADRLVVLERGSIVEIGPHAELLAKHGTYARFYKSQLEGLQSAAEEGA
ncbi:cyanophycin metabolism-associated ABC transporter [Paludibaculum fermentans]|uniref:ATP-binding cassette domain-containing protein n=1 Tax=Paludibaculum fermentans TaxID=1473598 RepID=A0A7S7NMP0_PALFE|nr:ABC transporter transmembrane domain-containing protein [Paludibaculum fermentans]QOY86420.1 ATP-binding cassette domain-containing protein [Paludibaculum fermentans]